MSQMIMQIPPQPSVSYAIKIGSDLFEHPETWLRPDWHNKRLVIITDDQVNKYYGEKLARALDQYKPLLLSFSPGEKSKNYQTKQYLEEQMMQHHCYRETLILSLGGGVVGDLAGFVASTYMRGVPYIQIPTTLLAMVDSSVGGKTGINTPQGKNLIGTFWQPSLVLIDMDCLTTLSQEHMINGLIEALKIFMTNDSDLLHYVSDNIEKILKKDLDILQNLIEQAIKIKVNIVSSDEKESHQRMILNFGHTIGHALEKTSNYKLLHGYAVALGILVESKISQLLGHLSFEDYQLIESIFVKLKILGNQLKELSFEKIIDATRSDKKAKEDKTRYVLLKKFGQVYNDGTDFAYPVSDEVVKQALLDVSGESYVG